MAHAPDSSPRLADNASQGSHASPQHEVSTTSSNAYEEAERGGRIGLSAAAEPATTEQPMEGLSNSGDALSGPGSSAPERTAVEKIHLLPVSEEAPKSWVFSALTEIMRESKIVRQYMYVKVKRPTQESPTAAHGLDSASPHAPQNPDAEYTYIVVACLPHSGIITPSTIVFTTGSPLKPLRRVQLLALVHPNSSYARRAGVASYTEALQRGLVGEAAAAEQRHAESSRGGGSSSTSSSSSSSSRRPDSEGPQQSEVPPHPPSTSSLNRETTVDETTSLRRPLGSPFDWLEQQEPAEGRQRRRRPERQYHRAEDVIAAVLDDSSSNSEGDSEDEENCMSGGTAFHLDDPSLTGTPEPERAAAAGSDRPLQQHRTLQRNFNFPSATGGEPGGSGVAAGGAEGRRQSSLRTLSEKVLFHEFVAPYFLSRSACASFPQSPSDGGVLGDARDTAVVVFPGKKIVIKDLTFVVWATDPENGPGFVRKDTAMYISVDPWGEYRRVHILPFADTLPTTYSFRLFEDYLQPFLKEQPWRLIRKGDIFTFRGVQFKVIATEPSTVPVARVGPDTVVHFEGSLNPSLIDILPPEILTRVRRLPARLQPFAIIAAAQTLDPQLLFRVLPAGNVSGTPAQRGIDEELEAAVERELVGRFCFAEYQQHHAHLCTQKPPESPAEKRGEKESGAAAAGEKDAGTPRASSTSPSSGASGSVPEAAKGTLEAPCCTVCTLQLQDGAETLTLICGHAFHWGCARAWLRCSATCPNCRAEVVLPSQADTHRRASQENLGTAALGFMRNALSDFFSA